MYELLSTDLLSTSGVIKIINDSCPPASKSLIQQSCFIDRSVKKCFIAENFTQPSLVKKWLSILNSGNTEPSCQSQQPGIAILGARGTAAKAEVLRE